jgi:hypothetical protein
MKLRSPHGLVREYSFALQRIIRRLGAIEDEDERLQDIAICVFLAVTMVEAFLNAYFRRLTLEPDFAHHTERLLADLQRRVTLDRKLRAWPRLFFPGEFDPNSSEVLAFVELKDRRNALMHFHSEPGVLRIGAQGVWMIDTKLYDGLAIEDAVNAANIGYAYIRSLIGLWQKNPHELNQQLSMWTGTRRRSA